MIPTFKSTEEAQAFGRTATEEERQELLRERSVRQATTRIREAYLDWDGAMVHATQAQFCREALEAKSFNPIDHEQMK